MTKSRSHSRFRHLCKLTLLAGCSLYGLTATAHAQTTTSDSTPAEETTTITVLGSRIPRTQKEGPAPVTVITSSDISARGFASVPDILKSVTQNSGETLSQQSYGGAIMTPGSAQVDLRGLGPNHTLIMINGRRVADFPMPFNGLSNFTDISNIPAALIDRVEVLSGSASAIYGSDAIAGVVNFTLKKNVEDTTLNYRYGMTQHGGGASHRLSLATGFNKDRLSISFGAQYDKQDPLWAFDRKIQDSRDDAPTARARYPFKVAQRYDEDASTATEGGTNCSGLTQLAGGTVTKTTDRFGDYYCASPTAVSYGTILSQREALNTFTNINYQLNDKTSLFAEVSLGTSDTALMNDVTYWRYQLADGSKADFYNEYSGSYENWARVFMPEEMGGLKKGMITNHSSTISVSPGIRGQFGDQWTYEAALNYSQYSSTIKIPQIVASKANAYYLGASLGVDSDGYDIFNADPAKLFTALTPAQYDSISEEARTNAKATTKGVSLTLNHPDIFDLPAGPVGFAVVAELDHQNYLVNPNPEATNFGYYYQYAATSGAGERSHQALGVEFNLPLLSTLQGSLATRYDQYKYDGHTIGKLTYNAGLEYRPVKEVLLRAAYGTGFRAPDLHYVFANLDLFHPSVTDYYKCRTEEPGTDYSDCSYADEDILKHREGNRKLKPETSSSYNYGAVWQPNRYFDISVDYFNVDMRDQVNDMSLDQVLRDEADCRVGTTDTGTAVNSSSPTCVDALSRVHRDKDGNISYVYINPINVSNEKTDGIDVEMHALWPTPYGQFKLSAGHTHVLNHTSVQYAGDAEVDRLAQDSGYYIPRDKTNMALTWSLAPVSVTVSGTRIGRLPNYDEDAWVKPWTLYNATALWDITPSVKATLTINNLLDTKPAKDNTWASYPYYNSNWYDSVGRSAYFELSYKFH
ncbi:TonB-dependent receptor domain-containing protein [Asticcacaulis sp. 201]|uniref:TonB-dependent receptor domain-containing protein n=1 Tax=Asticcacaulis sp. 201 TaxID=3028787 RepID=UPI0029169E16|nr:TonB-dependent receptor [Asticcacaulis sp. 201]MDV6330262.1 TonB-dependent receptor [Asticcacaulis sp. 201]